jgi:predicted enzyme related to lactoylglutathione lyase
MGWQVFQIGSTPGKPSDDGEAAYTVWMAGWTQVGGMLQGMVGKGDEPLGWVPFMAVENVDECVKRAVELGGEVVEVPFDVPNSGRFALLRDPQGALFGVAKPLGTEDR